MCKKPLDVEILYGQWIHSHEEDSADEMVFRPPSYEFPLSRGRAAFELNSDSSYVGAGVGSTDISDVTIGRWRLVSGDQLQIFAKNGDSADVLEIISLNKDQLIVRKKR